MSCHPRTPECIAPENSRQIVNNRVLPRQMLYLSLRASRLFWFSSAKLRCFISTISFTFSSIYEHQTQLSNSSFLFVNTANVSLQSNAGPNSQSSPKDFMKTPTTYNWQYTSCSHSYHHQLAKSVTLIITDIQQQSSTGKKELWLMKIIWTAS